MNTFKAAKCHPNSERHTSWWRDDSSVCHALPAGRLTASACHMSVVETVWLLRFPFMMWSDGALLFFDVSCNFTL